MANTPNTHFTHMLVITTHVRQETVIGAQFYAQDDVAAAKIARAIVRTWAAATKNRPDPITKEMVRLVPIKQK